MDNIRRLKVNGFMKLPGGTFGDVVVNGGAELTSGVTASDFEVNGMAKVRGVLKAENITVKGRAEVHGGIEAKKVRVEGSAYARNSVKAEEILVKGELRTLEGISTESFIGMGRFTIEGLLNAEKITIVTYSDCRVDELGGREINVGKTRSGWDSVVSVLLAPFGYREGELSAKTIEGDDIHLEYTRADFVRGNNVTIGDGCVIGLVEYSGTYRVNGANRVKECKKI